MTKLKTVNIGMNKYCGPAVLSILTGRSTDECAKVIRSINGSYEVAGVQLEHLLKAANKLGFESELISISGSLYRTLTGLASRDGIYIITVPNHFIVIEVNNKEIYFCDNHTKEPIRAASSARLMQACLACHRVERRKDYVEPPIPQKIKEELIVNIHNNYDDLYVIEVERKDTWNIKEHNTTEWLGTIRIKKSELHELHGFISEFVRQLNEKNTLEQLEEPRTGKGSLD